MSRRMMAYLFLDGSLKGKSFNIWGLEEDRDCRMRLRSEEGVAILVVKMVLCHVGFRSGHGI
jgi:hypothetical protein